MDDNFENRTRYVLFQDARYALQAFQGWIVHLLINEDKTFSIMHHANVEWCDYCDQRNAAYKIGLRYDQYDTPLIHVAKANPYEDQKSKFDQYDTPLNVVKANQ